LDNVSLCAYAVEVVGCTRYWRVRRFFPHA
jgi:hypothetical protein